MSVPDHDRNGELPPGEHEATLSEIDEKFGKSSPRRIALMNGLKNAVKNFQSAGVQKIWVNGSFVTTKLEPNDIDGCWEYSDFVNVKKLDPVFLQKSRMPMKAKFGLEFFPACIVEGDSGLPFPSFFQINRDGDPKGILIVDLSGVIL